MTLVDGKFKEIVQPKVYEYKMPFITITNNSFTDFVIVFVHG